MKKINLALLLTMMIALWSCTEKSLVEDFVPNDEMTEIQTNDDQAGKLHIIGPPPPPPCERNTCVGYWGMPDELNYLMDCLYPNGPCPVVESTSSITLGYSNGWLWEGDSDANFNCGQQDDFLADAMAYAMANAPECEEGNLQISYDFFLDFLTGPGGYFLGVNITYTCCGQGIVGPPWAEQHYALEPGPP